MNRVAYTAIVLSEQDRFELLVALKGILGELVRKGFTTIKSDGEPVCHHMTLKMGEASDEMKPFIGQKATINLTHFGYNDKAMAVKASSWFPEMTCHNAVAHVTMAVHKGNGGKPKDSNQIIEWTKLTQSFCVEGVATEVLA